MLRRMLKIRILDVELFDGIELWVEAIPRAG